MAFAFYLMFAMLNLFVRCVMDKQLRKKFNILDIAVLGQLMLSLGAGIYAWATVRHASIWTVTVVWPHFVDSWLFRQGSDPAIYDLPTMAKLHVILGSIAVATMLQSRILTILLLPKPRLWRLDDLLGDKAKVTSGFEAGRAIALMYGVSAEDKHKHHGQEHERHRQEKQ
jgi:nitrate reductase gamma subunit